VRLTLIDFSNTTILNRVFYESVNGVDIDGNGVTYDITVEPLPLGIKFGVGFWVCIGWVLRLLMHGIACGTMAPLDIPLTTEDFRM
jgi:hypothetical protein